MDLMIVLLMGLVLGIKHAMEPDHVIAVSTIVSRTKKLFTACLVGVSWGIGHTLTLFVVGMIFILMKKEIPSDLAKYLEFAVGIMLVYLGISNFFFTKKEHDHGHTHTHENTSHLKSILIGSVHGLSGSAALILLTMATIEHPLQGALYIALFGVGTIIGMMISTLVIGIPFAMSSKNKKLNQIFTKSAGLVSILFGIYYMYSVGVF